LDDPALFINREVSWIRFNYRVLEEAEDPSQPLLERVKFLAISGGNLDEFFMTRASILEQQIERGDFEPTPGSRMTPLQQIKVAKLFHSSRNSEGAGRNLCPYWLRKEYAYCNPPT
jgi:polyphosphate kinase